MAQIDIGKLTFTHKGDYAGGTAYVLNDVVYYNGSAYIAKTSTTGNLPTSTAHWNTFSAGSGGIWNSGLSLGSAGQSVKVNSAGNALEFGTISSGTYSLHDFKNYGYNTNVASPNADTTYVDIAGGNYLSFTPTSTNDVIQFFGRTTSYSANTSSGGSVYVNYGTSTSLSSSNTSILRAGTHANYTGGASDFYRELWCNSYLACTSLTPNTTYYAELAGMMHNSTVQFNNGVGGSNNPIHYLCMIHYKRN